MHQKLTSLELCAGAGGQALGLEGADFEHAGLIELDSHACATLRKNRPDWNVIQNDLFESFDFSRFKGVDLLTGGLPCPPFSVAGRQLGEKDERNLFTRGLEIADEVKPEAIMFENVRGMMSQAFDAYRDWIEVRLKMQNFSVFWLRVNASDFGVPQLRPRIVMVALKRRFAEQFVANWQSIAPPTVGETLHDLMACNGWRGAGAWARKANKIAPTIVGGSKKHGGADLGPTRARLAWAELGVEARTIAETAPAADFDGMPRLTVRMVARLQGFPDSWQFSGGKTAAYKQVGNAFPPPVAKKVALSVRQALLGNISSNSIAAE